MCASIPGNTIIDKQKRTMDLSNSFSFIPCIKTGVTWAAPPLSEFQGFFLPKCPAHKLSQMENI